MRVIIDTCVWVAAVKSRRGASFAILSEIPYKRFSFGISVPLFLEYKAKLYEIAAHNVTTLTHKHMDSILAALAFYGVEVPIYFILRPNLKDENDNMVYECAVNFGASAIITHNIKDFTRPELKGYNLTIVRPGEFINNLRRKL